MTDQLSSLFEKVTRDMDPEEKKIFTDNINKKLADATIEASNEARAAVKARVADEYFHDFVSEISANQGDRQAIETIKNKYRNVGLPVDNLDLTRAVEDFRGSKIYRPAGGEK